MDDAIGERTPASIGCLEYFQSNLPSVLYNSVLAIHLTVASSIAFVDMISSVEESIP